MAAVCCRCTNGRSRFCIQPRVAVAGGDPSAAFDTTGPRGAEARHTPSPAYSTENLCAASALACRRARSFCPWLVGVAAWWRLGAFACALSAAGFAQAYQIERAHTDVALPPWLVSRRNAILLLTLFAIGGAWTGFLAALLAYCAISFFFVQYLVHHLRTELTPH